MFLSTFVALLAQVASTVQTAVDPNAPFTVNSLVIIMTAAGVLMASIGSFAMQLVNAYLALRNGMKSDINSVKADVNAVKIDAAAIKAENTSVKVEQMHSSLNGELAAQRALIEKSSFAEGAKSETDKAAAGAKTQPLIP